VSGAHLHSVGLVTADLAAALDFYRLLGLDIPDGTDGDVAVAPAQGPAGSALVLTWATRQAISELDADRASDPALRIQMEIGYYRAGAVDAAYAKAAGAGVVPPFDAPWGTRFAVVNDPDGNRVGLTAPL
jgi:catechol 2,3-dioxygenase-like lactoylglutathione lyase family enzyme